MRKIFVTIFIIFFTCVQCRWISILRSAYPGRTCATRPPPVKKVTNCPPMTLLVKGHCLPVVVKDAIDSAVTCPPKHYFYGGKCRPFIKGVVVRSPESNETMQFSIAEAQRSRHNVLRELQPNIARQRLSFKRPEYTAILDRYRLVHISV